MKDYYKILGITKYATSDEIKTAFRNKSLKYHPDKNLNIDSKKKKLYKIKFNLIVEAYQVLSDPYKRGRYDSEFERNNSLTTDFFPSNTNLFNNFFSDFNRVLKFPDTPSTSNYNSFSSYSSFTNKNGEKKVVKSYNVNNSGKKDSYREEYEIDKSGNKKNLKKSGNDSLFNSQNKFNKFLDNK